MKIIHIPEKPFNPKPPFWKMFIPVGTIAENDGVLWILKTNWGDKYWKRYDGPDPREKQ